VRRCACAGPWSASEDQQLTELVGQYGGKHWARIASLLPGRTGKQCRERWCNNLDPSLKKGAWTNEVRTHAARRGPHPTIVHTASPQPRARCTACRSV
jgi:hypothetical protein